MRDRQVDGRRIGDRRRGAQVFVLGIAFGIANPGAAADPGLDEAALLGLFVGAGNRLHADAQRLGELAMRGQAVRREQQEGVGSGMGSGEEPMMTEARS